MSDEEIAKGDALMEKLEKAASRFEKTGSRE